MSEIGWLFCLAAAPERISYIDAFSRELASQGRKVFVRSALAGIALCTTLLLAAEHRCQPSQLSPRTTAGALLADDDARFL